MRNILPNLGALLFDQRVILSTAALATTFLSNPAVFQPNKVYLRASYNLTKDACLQE
jgi:hypothetical protein